MLASIYTYIRSTYIQSRQQVLIIIILVDLENVLKLTKQDWPVETTSDHIETSMTPTRGQAA